MAIWLDNLVTARDNLSAQLADITLHPKPNYSVDGETYSWMEYQRFLAEQIAATTDMIAKGEAGFEIVSQGVT